MHPLVQENIPLAKYTTFGIGGNARFFAEAESIEVFLHLYKWGLDHNQSIFILGMGSNVVFSDQGFDGLVIRYTAKRFTFQENIAVVEAAMPLSLLILEAEKVGLGGLENLFGIPGTVGGALYNNAGAHGTSIGSLLESALIFLPYTNVEIQAMQLLDRTQMTIRKPEIVKPDFFRFAYRMSSLQRNHAIVLSTTFNLTPKDPKEIQKTRQEINQWRQEKQPIGRSAGSFFKNPSNEIAAGLLLERVGAKGMTEGGIQVSEKHANFLINTGKGTFADLKKLSEKLEQLVWERFKVKLEREVQFVRET